jgi:signal transduction histidine kinase
MEWPMANTSFFSVLLHRAWPGTQKAALAPDRTPNPSSRLPLYQNPKRLLVLLAIAIFFGETCIMFLLTYFQPLPVVVEALLDATMLLIVISPTFYFLLFRPFMQHLQLEQKSQQEIRKLSQRLMVAAEAERKKVAMDLHDHFGQRTPDHGQTPG